MRRVMSLQTPTVLWLGGGIISQLLNLNRDNDVRLTEIHTAEPLVAEPSAFKVEMATEKLKRHKSPGIYHIPAKLIKEGGSKICSEILKLINSVWNKEELPEQWKKSITVPIYKTDDKTVVVIIETYHCCQLRTKFYHTSFCKV
jgi:hypothetical protein